MAVLRIASFHSCETCKLMKIQQFKRRSRRKTDSNFDFLETAKCKRGFKKKECSARHGTLFTPDNTI